MNLHVRFSLSLSLSLPVSLSLFPFSLSPRLSLSLSPSLSSPRLYVCVVIRSLALHSYSLESVLCIWFLRLIFTTELSALSMKEKNKYLLFD